MTDTDKRYCTVMLDIITKHGVRDIVLSPGSRNAPVIISAYQRDDLKKYVICDERNASFFALGLALVKQRPVAICCTSGTAMYNYAPAVAEAFYQQIPLIVITADRPEEWIDQNDSQTLVQPFALDKIVKKTVDIPLDSNSEDTSWFVNRMMNEAMILANSGRRGPVHVNIRFNSPLCGTVLHNSERLRVIRDIPVFPYLHPQDLIELTEKLSSKKIMVIAGYMPPNNKLNRHIADFCQLPQTVLLSETLSNLHLSGNPYAIDTVLSGLSDEEKETLAPDIVISIGGAPVSRILKEFIRKCPECEVWTLGDTYVGTDCFQKLTLHIDLDPTTFFKAVYSRLKKLRLNIIHYQKMWDKVK